MNKVLLLNPNSRKKDSVEELPLITPPINLMYVAQSLIDTGYKAEILDGLALNLSDKDILNYIKKKHPSLIGIPLYSSDLTKMYVLTELIKKQNPGVKIFFAGHHASALPKQVMQQFPNIDFIVRDEGEFTTVNLLKALEKDQDLKKVKGISYRQNGKVRHNPSAPPIEDLDKVPIPSRKLINPYLYYSRMSKRSNVDVLITTRGCPYRCTYCAKLNEFFKSHRERSINNIMQELRMIKATGTNAVEIYDETFTLKKKRVMAFIEAVKKEKMDFEFRIRTRVTHVDREMLQGLKSIGVSTISYGVESGSQKVLNKMKKDTTLKQVEKAFYETEKAGINILGFFMIGNRGETPATIRQTVNFAKKLNPLFATFSVLIPYPGTADYIEAKNNGTLQGDYAPFKPRPWIKLPWMNDISELYEYSTRAYNEYYKRPAYVTKFLKNTVLKGNFNLVKYSLSNFYKDIIRVNPI